MAIGRGGHARGETADVRVFRLTDESELFTGRSRHYFGRRGRNGCGVADVVIAGDFQQTVSFGMCGGMAIRFIVLFIA